MQPVVTPITSTIAPIHLHFASTPPLLTDPKGSTPSSIGFQREKRDPRR